ncbi:adenosylcobinamide-phosphate synthase CbiB [Candidatus Poriferisodalis sp.]|uniref:adenosylcobinamide-phosphate synthase CbiB n=1 Tax=Candidatus Poriferisodalis sp. TaxID=3101277 RepID=UPI003B51D4A1
MNQMARRSGAAALGLLGDRIGGEPPPSVHPVRGFGSLMTKLEQRIWADRRSAGVVYAATGVTVGAVVGTLLRSTACAVALTAAGRELRSVALQIADHLAADEMESARAALPALVGRDPSELDESGIAAAVIESVAENSVDAVVAPVFWAVVAGSPGATAYRAVNTMDAMVGRLDERYRQFGWAAARIDDVANYVPARLFAVLVAALRPRRARAIWQAVCGDAPAHPSPNAGVAEAAVAAAIERELGGPLRYGTRHEDRPRLGDGPRPSAADIDATVRLASQVELLVTALTGAIWITHMKAIRRARNQSVATRQMSTAKRMMKATDSIL